MLRASETSGTTSVVHKHHTTGAGRRREQEWGTKKVCKEADRPFQLKGQEKICHGNSNQTVTKPSRTAISDKTDF